MAIASASRSSIAACASANPSGRASWTPPRLAIMGTEGAAARKAFCVCPDSNAARWDPTANPICSDSAISASAKLIAIARSVPPVIAPINKGRLTGRPQNSVVTSIIARSHSGNAQCSNRTRSKPVSTCDWAKGSSASAICSSFRLAVLAVFSVILFYPNSGCRSVAGTSRQPTAYAAPSMRQAR